MPALDSELAEEIGDVELHRSLGDVQLASNLLVGEVLEQRLEDLPLAVAEIGAASCQAATGATG